MDVSHSDAHVNHQFDVVTTLKTELAASNYRRERLLNELTELKSILSARDSECKSLRTQIARQSVLIESLRSRLLAAEQQCRSGESKAESAIQTLQREKNLADDRIRELSARNRSLESDLSFVESNRDQVNSRHQDFVRRLCHCLGVDICDSGVGGEPSELTNDTIIAKATDLCAENERLRAKSSATCETLHNCEQELLATRTEACNDKQRLQQQFDALQMQNRNLELRCKQSENNLKLTRDHLTECQSERDALRDELRGFESRCNRLQSSADALEHERRQFLQSLAGMIAVSEPCETLIKERIRDIFSDNQTMQTVNV